MAAILQEMQRRVLLGDGSVGGYALRQAEKAGLNNDVHFWGHRGLPDILCATSFDFVRQIHRDYLAAGADIVLTNSFNANDLYFRQYHGALEGQAYTLNFAAAQLAREVVDEFSTIDRLRFVVGSIGPGAFERGKCDLGDKYDFMFPAYKDQICGLIDGGVDACLIETCTEEEQIRAALDAFDNVRKERGADIPVFLSVVLTETGATWRGVTARQIADIAAQHDVAALGVNCVPPHLVGQALRAVGAVWPGPLLCQPNGGAGFLQAQAEIVADLRVRLIGGCCGTTPRDIHALATVVRRCLTRGLGP